MRQTRIGMIVVGLVVQAIGSLLAVRAVATGAINVTGGVFGLLTTE